MSSTSEQSASLRPGLNASPTITHGLGLGRGVALLKREHNLPDKCSAGWPLPLSFSSRAFPGLPGLPVDLRGLQPWTVSTSWSQVMLQPCCSNVCFPSVQAGGAPSFCCSTRLFSRCTCLNIPEAGGGSSGFQTAVTRLQLE